MSKKNQQVKLYNLKLRRINTLSALKLSGVYGVGVAVVSFVTMMLLWLAIDALGIFSRVISLIAPDGEGIGAKLSEWTSIPSLALISLGVSLTLFSLTIFVMLTATIIFNTSAKITGGVSLVLSESSDLVRSAEGAEERVGEDSSGRRRKMSGFIDEDSAYARRPEEESRPMGHKAPDSVTKKPIVNLR